MKTIGCLMIYLMLTGSILTCYAVESGMCRLLSVSESEKLILISTIPEKKKYLLDVAGAKITIDGKPAEFDEITAFSLIQVKWKKSSDKRNGVPLDGVALEIEIDSPRKPQSK